MASSEPAAESGSRRIVAITGSSGMIGSALATALERDGWGVLRIVRGPAAPGEVSWAPSAGRIDARALEGVGAVVNLAGENIGQRWTPEVKEKIRRSRVEGTRVLAVALASNPAPPDVLVNASAVGYYGSRGDELLTEESGPGSDFLAGVVREWEAATGPAVDAGIRTVTPRFGVVLSHRGGVLGRLLLPFRLGLGGRVGDGKQWMSWISIDDLVDAIRFLIATPEVSGPIVTTSPNPVTNAEFTAALGSVLGRPTLLPVPKMALRLAFGEMADETLFTSQRAVPAGLTAAGFRFNHPRITDALRAVIG